MEFSIFAEYENDGYGVSYFEIARAEFSAMRTRRDSVSREMWHDDRYRADEFEGWWVCIGRDFYPVCDDEYDVLAMSCDDAALDRTLREIVNRATFPNEFVEAFVYRFEER